MNQDFRDDLKYYAKVAQRGLGYVAGQLELTSKCEQTCPNCDSWKKHRSGEIQGRFDIKTLKDLFQEMSEMPAFEHLALTGGDPQSHPDFEHLVGYVLPQYGFRKQVNTALPLEPAYPSLWRKNINSLRVSLDGVSKETYYKMRGVHTDPEEILDRLERLNHPYWATNTCVASANIDEVPAIVERLSRMRNPPRKAMFLAVIGRDVDSAFWHKYNSLKERIGVRVNGLETSVAEDVIEVRHFLQGPAAADIPCYAGNITFHIKCTGEVYPCCLVGGEAIETVRSKCIGNVYASKLLWIQKRYAQSKHMHYAESAICREVCQWKQLQINRLGAEAEKIHLRMP